MFFDALRKVARGLKERLVKEKRHREEIDDLKEKFKYHEKILKKQEEAINQLKKALTKKTNKLNTLEKKVNEQEELLQKLCKKNKKQKQISKTCEDTNKNVQQAMEFVYDLIRTQSHWCPYVWEIKKFTNKRKLAKFKEKGPPLASEPFFMLSGGYKAQLELYPNGCDDHVNTHVGLYIKLLKGPFDDILRWPLIACIQLSIINEKGERENACSFTTNNLSIQNAFQRPVEDDSLNMDWGFSKFVALEDIPKYLDMDTLKLCVEVWTINM